MMGHTPGPWYLRGPLKDWESGVPGGRPPEVVVVDPESGEECDLLDGLSEGNGNLIAAAPDLLEALKAAYRFEGETRWPADFWQPDWFKAARAAIAKAEGRDI